MKYKVIKGFKGSPDGRFTVTYPAGEIVDLTESLAAVAVSEGWVEALPGEEEEPAVSPATSRPARRKKPVEHSGNGNDSVRQGDE